MNDDERAHWKLLPSILWLEIKRACQHDPVQSLFLWGCATFYIYIVFIEPFVAG